MRVITIKKGSVAYNLIMLTTITQGLPINSLHLIGNERIYKLMMLDLLEPQIYRNPETDERIAIKNVLNKRGKGKYKTLALSRNVEPILDWMGLKDYYSKFYVCRGGKEQIERTHKIAECIMMSFRNGFLDLDVYTKGLTENSSQCPKWFPLKNILSDNPTQVSSAELRKYRVSSRATGVLMNNNSFYPLYNIGNDRTRMYTKPEYKLQLLCEEKARKNSNIFKVDKIIMLGKTYEVGWETIIDEKNIPISTRTKVYFVPSGKKYDNFRHQLFQLLAWIPNLTDRMEKEKIINIEAEKPRGIECDYRMGDFYIYCFFDSNLSRLQRFYRGIKALKEEEEILAIRGERRREIRYAIYCFKEQEEFIANIFPEAEIKTINIKEVCKLFSIGTEDF